MRWYGKEMKWTIRIQADKSLLLRAPWPSIHAGADATQPASPVRPQSLSGPSNGRNGSRPCADCALSRGHDDGRPAALEDSPGHAASTQHPHAAGAQQQQTSMVGHRSHRSMGILHVQRHGNPSSDLVLPKIRILFTSEATLSSHVEILLALC